MNRAPCVCRTWGIASSGGTCRQESRSRDGTTHNGMVTVRPEIVLGATIVTPAIDMWSVGCIAASLLTVRPHHGDGRSRLPAIRLAWSRQGNVRGFLVPDRVYIRTTTTNNHNPQGTTATDDSDGSFRRGESPVVESDDGRLGIPTETEWPGIQGYPGYAPFLMLGRSKTNRAARIDVPHGSPTHGLATNPRRR